MKFYHFESRGALAVWFQGLTPGEQQNTRSACLYATAAGDVYVPESSLDATALSRGYGQIESFVEDIKIVQDVKIAEAGGLDAFLAREGWGKSTVDDSLLFRMAPSLVEGLGGETYETVRAGTLEPIKTPWASLLLAIRPDAPQRHFQGILRELALMDDLDFEYTVIEDSDAPFKVLVRINGNQFFSNVHRWVHQRKKSVLGVFVPWGLSEQRIWVSFGYNWTCDPALAMAQLQDANDILLVAGENGNSAPAALTLFKVTLSGRWIDGPSTDATGLFVPSAVVPVVSDGGATVPLEFTLRLETDHSLDDHRVRLRHLHRMVKSLREEIAYVTGLIERRSRHPDSVRLYLYQARVETRKADSGSNPPDFDRSLRALLLDHPIRSLQRLLHARIGTGGVRGAGDPGGDLIEGPMDIILDRTLSAQEGGRGMWGERVEASVPEFASWTLSSEYYPSQGGCFDLEMEIYSKHGIALFLPRGTALRPRLDFENLPMAKVVDLICGLGGAQQKGGALGDARAKPDQYLFILMFTAGSAEHDVSLLAVKKGSFDPLGHRVEFINRALAGVSEQTQCLPPNYGSLAAAWASEAVAGLFRKEAKEHVDVARQYLTSLKDQHTVLLKEVETHKKECARLVDQAKAVRNQAETELGQWQQLIPTLENQRHLVLKDILDGMAEADDRIKAMVDMVGGDVDATHRGHLKGLSEKCQAKCTEIQRRIRDLDARIAKATNL